MGQPDLHYEDAELRRELGIVEQQLERETLQRIQAESLLQQKTGELGEKIGQLRRELQQSQERIARVQHALRGYTIKNI